MIGEYFKILLCISYWETRKIRGILTPFFIWHNLACDLKINLYRKKLNRLKIKP